jgi:hypothetical protein
MYRNIYEYIEMLLSQFHNPLSADQKNVATSVIWFGYNSLLSSGGGGGIFSFFHMHTMILSAIMPARIGGEERPLGPLYIILLSVQH